MVFDLLQRLNRLESIQECQRLGRRSPIGFRISRSNKYVQQQDDDVGGDGRAVVHEEHDNHAEQSCEERKPRTVVAEGRSPVGSLRDARVEHGEVYQGERGHEEVGQDT